MKLARSVSPTTSKPQPVFSKSRPAGFFGDSERKTGFFSSTGKQVPAVQAKLTVGKANDEYERQADAMADQVVQRLAQPAPLVNTDKNNHQSFNHSIPPAIQNKCAACEQEEKQKEKEEKPERELRRKPIFESDAEPRDEETVQRLCEHCAEEEKVQKKGEIEPAELRGDKEEPAAGSQKPPGEQTEKFLQKKCTECAEEEKIQKSGSSGESNNLASTEKQLQSSKGRGNRLSDDVRQQMESSLGADFSGVRIHNDHESTQLSKNLNAQAFTHGSDVYFNEGKYNPSSAQGKHLLAHELTHTIQQGKSSSIQNKSQSAPEIQKADEKKTPINSLDAAALKALGEIKEGYMTKENGKVAIHFKDFPSKQYVGPFVNKDSAGNEYVAGPPFKKPTAERKTRQSTVWKKEALPKVTALINNFIKKNNVTGTEYELKLKKKKNVAVTGTVDQIAKQVTVPFWGMDGLPISFQIEHKVDWQIAGGNHNVDVISNLILLDAKSNINIGQTILASMKSYYGKVIDYYSKQKNVDGLTDSFSEGAGRYDIYCDNLVSVGQEVKGTLISISNFEETSVQTPFKDENIDIGDLKIPDNVFVLKTSKTGAGMFVPWNFDNDYVHVKGDQDKKKLHSITLKNVIKDENGVVDQAQPDKNLKFYPEGGEGSKRYKVDSEGYAVVLREVFRGIKGASPIVWNDDIDFDPKKGWNATGKVVSDIELLKNVDISIFLENSVFTVQASITSDALKDKLPKPFRIDYCTLGIAISTKEPFTIFGELGFGIDKLGKGYIGASVKKKGFGLEGKFEFESEKLKGSGISFKYAENKWTVAGNVKVAKDAITGVQEAGLTIEYNGDRISAVGSAKLKVPGIDKVNLEAEFREDNSFYVKGDVELKQLPGIKPGGKVGVGITKPANSDQFKLSVTGKVSPDFPNVPGLTTELSVSYDDGVFEIRTKVNYKKGRFDGTIDIGVTNKTVDEKGQPQGPPSENSPLLVFGFGQLTVDLFKGNKGTVSVRVTPEKNVLVAGEILIQNVTPFGPGYDFHKRLIDFPRITIPLLGIPGLSISAFVDGSVNFKFNWQPLVLKELKVGFKETDINELETITLDIKGSVGSSATAELYMEIKAGLEARALIATLSGAIGGQAGLGVTAEAGGELNAAWNMEKGLQFKEIRAYLNVTPKAIFKLTGSISVDLDLLFTSVNLYYKEWTLAEKQLDLGGLTLNVDFPIKFDENGNIIMPSYEQMNVQKPDLSGDQGKKVLDKSMNADAEKEMEQKKQEIRATVKRDLRDPKNESMSPSEYTQKMKGKYKDSAELQEHVVKSVEEESKLLEYEQFDKYKSELRAKEWPLQQKFTMITFFTMYRRYISQEDIQAFKDELARLEEEKKLQSVAPPAAATPPPPNGSTTPAVNGAAPVQRKPIDQVGNKEIHVQKKPDVESDEQKPFSEDPSIEFDLSKPIPGATQKPDRSDTLKITGLWWFHAQRIKDETKKLHPDRRLEFEDSIFFDFDSASLHEVEKKLKIDRDLSDPNNPGGWLARADKKKLKITLRGNASEEGNPVYNLALSKRRVKAVANALKHPNITIIKEESIFGKDKTVDFRRARRVDIIEEGVAGVKADPGDCTKAMEKIMEVKSRSITFLDKAALDILLALRKPGEAESETTRTIVGKWFNKSDQRTMTAVAEGLSKISSALAKLDPANGNLTCQVTGKPPVEHCSEGIGARASDVPFEMIICSKIEKVGEGQRLEIFIHEAGHAAGFMKDFAFHKQRIFKFVETSSKLQMPDGFVGVTLELNKTLEKADVEIPTLGKEDKVKCSAAQADLAEHSLALSDLWLADSVRSVRELYDKSAKKLLPEHVETVRTNFDATYNENNVKTTAGLYARFEELRFAIEGELNIVCLTDVPDTTGIGGLWEETSSGIPGKNVFLFPKFFTLAAADPEKGALLFVEMLATASGFIEARHRRAFAKMAQSFSKSQDKNLWRKKGTP